MVNRFMPLDDVAQPRKPGAVSHPLTPLASDFALGDPLQAPVDRSVSRFTGGSSSPMHSITQPGSLLELPTLGRGPVDMSNRHPITPPGALPTLPAFGRGPVDMSNAMPIGNTPIMQDAGVQGSPFGATGANRPSGQMLLQALLQQLGE